MLKEGSEEGVDQKKLHYSWEDIQEVMGDKIPEKISDFLVTTVKERTKKVIFLRVEDIEMNLSWNGFDSYAQVELTELWFSAVLQAVAKGDRFFRFTLTSKNKDWITTERLWFGISDVRLEN